MSTVTEETTKNLKVETSGYITKFKFYSRPGSSSQL